MRLHILGICGTFMAGVARLAKESGYEVTGSDLNIYPPMSTQLAELAIPCFNGFDPAHIDPSVDAVIVGNVIRRGNPAMEYVLDKGIRYYSGPEWLYTYILQRRTVLAVSGTHGKTTTSSLLSWVLSANGLESGFLIGGVPENFGVSARLGQSPYFVIEADEYDSAFFDKRSKFLHYHPQILVMNNLEFDHADIFPDLAAIQQQFHYLVRTVPGKGRIVVPKNDPNLAAVLAKGCWTPVTEVGAGGAWTAELLRPDGSAFTVLQQGQAVATVEWGLLGQHNIANALVVFAAAAEVGLTAPAVAQALASFKNVKRRLEVKGVVHDMTVYDDFAHHPTAIATTLAGLRARVGQARIIVVLEFGSYTMRQGVHQDKIAEALAEADRVLCKRPEQCQWDVAAALSSARDKTEIYDDVDGVLQGLQGVVKPGDHIVVMSNSGFGNIHQKLLTMLQCAKEGNFAGTN